MGRNIVWPDGLVRADVLQMQCRGHQTAVSVGIWVECLPDHCVQWRLRENQPLNQWPRRRGTLCCQWQSPCLCWIKVSVKDLDRI